METVKKEFYMGYITWVAQQYNDHSIHVSEKHAKTYRGEAGNERLVAESSSILDTYKINKVDKEEYERSYHHFLEIDVKKNFSDKEVYPVMNYLWSYFQEQGHVKTDWLVSNKDGLLNILSLKNV
ncbi:hypothetical protein EVJ32_04975 [Exiguobacterium sp. SH5S4]|uniref:hypothetical protein n=1 Tax=Exiguobacterium sp. SH5S4 TaxID=2510961 RepID=UPI001040DD47|nr:hypothetical protein [Exiguobacterium sp. SH5S4]TCI26730.1 hypothetical protein EVJ32_04975 [Exiguobacterium sp. SH5S4]